MFTLQPVKSDTQHTSYKPVHSSVRIKNSAWRWPDSSFPILAAAVNWTILMWPDKRF